VLIQGRDFIQYLKYFDLKPDFSIEELERKRYIKEKEGVDNIEDINNKYHSLLEVKLNDLTIKNKEIDKNELKKTLFVQGFNEQYNKKLPTYKGKEELNNRIKAVNDVILSINQDINVRDVYDNYIACVKDFMNSYTNELDKKNKSQATNIIKSNKEKVINDVAYLLNNSLDVIINNYNSNVKKDVIECKTNNYLLLTINSAFKDVQKFFDNEKYDSILGEYRNEINTFLLTKYNYYTKKLKNKNVLNQEEKDKEVELFYADFTNSIHAYSSSLFRKIYPRMKKAIEDAKEDDLIDNSLYMILYMQLEKANTFDDLAAIYHRLYEDNRKVRFAK